MDILSTQLVMKVRRMQVDVQHSGATARESATGTELEEKPMGQRYILVIDDDPGMHTLLGLILNPLQLEVKYALDGYKALDMIDRRRPDLIILDLAMPNLSGVDILENLSQEPEMAGIPVMIFSATSDIAMAAKYEWPPQVVEVLQKSRVRTTELRQLVQDRVNL